MFSDLHVFSGSDQWRAIKGRSASKCPNGCSVDTIFPVPVPVRLFLLQFWETDRTCWHFYHLKFSQLILHYPCRQVNLNSWFIWCKILTLKHCKIINYFSGKYMPLSQGTVCPRSLVQFYKVSTEHTIKISSRLLWHTVCSHNA